MVRLAIGTIEIEAGLLRACDDTQTFAAHQLIRMLVGPIYAHGKTAGDRDMALVPTLTIVALFRLAQSRRY
jgi:hypothetical protein